MAWHSKPKPRIIVGREAEQEFVRTFGCYCGGDFKWAATRPGTPDFQCSACSMCVDVKHCKDAEDYASITLSQPAFDHYDDAVLIIAKFGVVWHGQRAGRLRPYRGDAYPSTHDPPYNTPFYKFAKSLFFRAENYVRRK